MIRSFCLSLYRLAGVAVIAMVCAVVSHEVWLHADAAETSKSVRVEFNRDIRPILSDRCFVCHGPDSVKRQAGLRLDRAADALAERDGSRAIVPRDLKLSTVYQRIISKDPDQIMPPPDSGARLSEKEVDLIRRWIEEGAEFQAHWSFIAPRPVTPPTDPFPMASRARADGIASVASTRNPVDAFVRAKLLERQLAPASDADKSSLLRRASFDLIGLPPSPDELNEFEGDSSSDAFEKQVDRLLASPRYGERMATLWLDAARYADTNGYQTDGPRFMWRYRDWVIDAFNRNQPFDEFTLHQLAGDLLADSDSTSKADASSRQMKSSFAAVADDRLIASGFNRNHRGNAEGGIIPEEFRVEYVVDRVETTSTVWLGLTIGCARCHDHKYDPISQHEFYQLFDFFNRVPEPGKYIRNSNSMPYLPAPTADQQLKLNVLQRKVDAAREAWSALAPVVFDGIRRQVDRVRTQLEPLDWSYANGLDAHIAFDGSDVITRPADKATEANRATDGNVVWQDGMASFTEGRFARSAEFDGRRWLNAGNIGDFGEEESFAISVWIKPRGREAMTVLARMDHENASRGYELRIESSGKLQALFAGRILDDLIRVETKQPLPEGQWSHIVVSYDGSSAARGVTVRVNGERSDLSVITDLLSNPIRIKLPLNIAAGGSAKPFVGEIDELRLYRGRLTDDVAMSLAAGETISALAAAGLNDNTPITHFAKLREWYMSQHAAEPERRIRQNVLDRQIEYERYLATIPTTMVMQDVPDLRQTRILNRGEYNKPGEVVVAAVPSAIHVTVPATGTRDGASGGTSRTKTDQRLNRYNLAQWLLSPDHPLTARVSVNRQWQLFFGAGLVKTAEDFGTQGELPSHPELLDWLAIEFEGGTLRQSIQKDSSQSPSPETRSSHPRWDAKRLQRLLITSSTYRQSSRADAASLASDPENRWLSRGPRFRLAAEMIRDAALFTSGLLVESLGGPSVKPYQPAGLWEELSAEAVPGPFSVYVQDHGANLYRRSLYTFQKRTVTTPSMAVFDASSRDFCRVKLPRTNTPLQALNLMNDITYLEAARVMAERLMRSDFDTDEARLAAAFRHILSRSPTHDELKHLVLGHQRRLSRFRNDAAAAAKLVSTGESPTDPSLAAPETAALTASVAVIMNLDEAANR